MAFSTTISHIILFIGATLAAYLLVNSLLPAIQDVSNSLVIQNELMSTKVRTILNIDEIYIGSTNFTIYLKNIGYEALPVNKTYYDVYLDGERKNITLVSLVKDINSNGIFDPGDVMTLVVNASVSAGIHEVKVVAQNGAYAKEKFSV